MGCAVARSFLRGVAAALLLIALAAPALASDAPIFVPFKRLTAAETQATVMAELGRHKFWDWYHDYNAPKKRYEAQERRLNTLRDGKDVTWVEPVWADKFSDPKIIGRMGKCGAKFSTVINAAAIVLNKAKHKKFGHEDFLTSSSRQEEWGVFDLPDPRYAATKILVRHSNEINQVYILDTRICMVNDQRSLTGNFDHDDYSVEGFLIGMAKIRKSYSIFHQTIGKNSRERMADIEVNFIAQADRDEMLYKGNGLVFFDRLPIDSVEDLSQK